MKKSAILGGLALLATGAWAETAPATNTSVQNVQAQKSWTDTMSVTLLFGYEGASMGDPFANYKTDPATGLVDTSSPIGFTNRVDVGWKLADNTTLQFRVPYAVSFSQPRPGTSILDPLVRLAFSKVVSQAGFNLNVDARLYAPISEASQKATLMTSFASVQSASYDIPDTKWTLALETAFRANLYRDGTLNNKRSNDAKIKAAPSANYQILDNLGIYLMYDMGAKHLVGMTYADWYNDFTYLEPGLSWDVTSNLNINPFVDIQTGQRVAADTSLIGITVVWKLL